MTPPSAAEPRAGQPSVPADPAVVDRVWTIPNVLSVLRLVLVPVFFWLILTRRDGWALATLTVSGFTDYLDGALARRWGQVSRIGQLLDPLADRLFILSTLLGLAWRDVVPWWLVAAVVGRDLLLSTTIPVLARYGYGPLPVHFLGKAATLNLLYAFPLLLLAELDTAVGAVAQPVAWGFTWWGVCLYWWAAWLYLRQVGQIVMAAQRAPASARIAVR